MRIEHIYDISSGLKSRASSIAIVLICLSLVTIPISFASANTYLPISSITSGATDARVNQENIGSTICLNGYTVTVRPSSSYTTSLKINQLGGSYARYHDLKTGDFEEDHLISLEIGGSPTSPKNLWPEPYAGKDGARMKDQLENTLHSLVCSGAMTLQTAQESISTNWISAYAKYVIEAFSTIVTPIQTTPPTIPEPPIPSPSPSPTPSGATGKCFDGTYSFAASHRGMCSRHGGVQVFYS